MEKLSKPLTVHFLVFNDPKIDTRAFASLYVGVCKVDKFGLNGGQLSAHFFCTLKEQYIIPGLCPIDFKCLRLSSDLLLESTSFL